MEEILELLNPEDLVEEVRALAQSGEKIEWEEFMYRAWRRCSADELDEEDFESLEDLMEEDEMILRFEEVLQKAAPRFVTLRYDDALGTDLTFRLVSFSPDSGAVLTLYIPDKSEISAKPIAGDLEKAFRASIRERLERSFDDTMWNRASAEFSSGVTLENEEEYPVGDEAFWEKLLGQGSEEVEP